MPDIAMCLNATCPHCTRCYRFLARPSTHQSYVDHSTDAKGVCVSLWPVEELPAVSGDPGGF